MKEEFKLRKSIKRIVSTVLAATMVFTSGVISNVSAIAAPVDSFDVSTVAYSTYTEGFYLDSANKFGMLASSANTVVVEKNNKTFADGATFTGRMKTGGAASVTPDGTTVDARALKINAAEACNLTVYAISSSSSADRNVNLCDAKGKVVDTKVITGVEPEGKIWPVTTFAVPAAGVFYLTTETGGLNFYGAYADKALNTVTLDPIVIAEAQEITTDAATEATTDAATEATTSAQPATEVTTDAATEATTSAPVNNGQISVTPVYKEVENGIDVDYMVSVADGAKFNNYTLFVNFDPAKLTPTTVTDGDIATTVKDAAGKDITLMASNAANITKQLTDVPAKNDSDFTGADGVKTQAQLGQIKVAYCVYDNDFSAAAGNLPAFDKAGKLFTIHFDRAASDINGTTLGVKVGALNAVSADLAVQSSPKSENTETVVDGTVDKTFAIAGDTVKSKTGENATVTFSLNNNPGVAAVVAIVTFDPTKLELTGGNSDAFGYDKNVIANQMAYVPVVGDPDYAGKADGTTPASKLGIVKLALANKGADVLGNTAFTLNFKVLATENGTYPVEIAVSSVANTDGAITEYKTVNGAVVIENGSTPVDPTTEVTTDATTEATTDAVTTEVTTNKETSTQATTDATTETTTRRSSSGGGGGGGNTIKVTTTTEATTEEVSTPSEPEKPIEVKPGTSVNPPVNKIDDFKGFEDIDNYPWAKDSINKLAELGIISGIADRTYGPALPCKRGDFAILINRTLGVKVTSTTKNFYDNENQDKYYYNDVLVGYNAGILSGYGDNSYKPEQYCTREEMAVLIAKSFEWLGNDVTSTDLSVNNKYSDVDNISFWSAPYVAYLTDKGIMNGNTDGTLLPKNYINRAEMAVMMSKVYDYALELVNAQRAELDINEVEG